MNVHHSLLIGDAISQREPISLPSLVSPQVLDLSWCSSLDDEAVIEIVQGSFSTLSKGGGVHVGG